MVAQAPITLDASAPDWARRAFRDVEKSYVKTTPSRPQQLAQFTSTALPSPADFAWCAIIITDKSCVAMSNGSAWLRADGSAL